MSHEYAQTAPSHVRLFSGDVELLSSLGQVPFVLDEIGSATESLVRGATVINSYRRSSDCPPPLAVLGDTYYTTSDSDATQYQATLGGPTTTNNYTQAHSHDLHIFGQRDAQHQNESSIIGWHTHSRPVTYFTQIEGSSVHLPAPSMPGNPQSRIMSSFTQITHGQGSTSNNHSRVTHNETLNHGNLNEIDSAHHSLTYSHAGCNSARSTLAIPQNNTILNFIHWQLPHDEVLMINDSAVFPNQGIDQHEVRSVAAVWPTHNHPSTSPQRSLTYSSVNSTSRNPQNDAEPYFNRATHTGSPTMNDGPQALHNNMGLLLSDTSEWCPPVGRDNGLHSIQSTAGWLPDNSPFMEPYYASPRYSTAYSVPGSPHNNTIPGGTQGQTPYQMTDNYFVYPINDSRSEYCVGARESACEWNDNNGPCGKNIILNWGSIREHVTSCHLGSRLPTNYPTQCRWKNCQLEECIRRDTTARHVCEVHFGIKRPKSKGVRNMIPNQL